MRTFASGGVIVTESSTAEPEAGGPAGMGAGAGAGGAVSGADWQAVSARAARPNSFDRRNVFMSPEFTGPRIMDSKSGRVNRPAPENRGLRRDQPG